MKSLSYNLLIVVLTTLSMSSLAVAQDTSSTAESNAEPKPRTSAASHTIRIVDADGRPIDQCEVLMPQRESKWRKAENGLWQGYFESDKGPVDVIVRAKGYVSLSKRIPSDSSSELPGNKTTLTLEARREVMVKFSLPEGEALPADVQIESYFTSFTEFVRLPKSTLNAPLRSDANMLNLIRVDDNSMSFRWPVGSDKSFYLALHHPGWLRYFEAGPFSNADIVDDVLQVDIPKPATITTAFNVRGVGDSDLPFAKVICRVYWKPEGTDHVYLATDHDVEITTDQTVGLSDLAPGAYVVDVNTMAKPGLSPVEGTDINPGEFVGRAEVSLKSGEVKEIHHDWKPFDPDAYLGDAKVRIKLLKQDGTIAAGEPVQVMWHDGHYGYLIAYEGHVPSDGILLLKGLSAKRRGFSPTGNQYMVAVGGQRIGFFTLDDASKTHDFQFRITPQAGERAPDFTLVDIASKQSTRLSKHRGKVVFLEFWSISCGPCQPAMEKLNQLAIRNKADWDGKVAILSVCMDDASDAAEHVASRGWNAISHYVSRTTKGNEFCDIAIDYGVYSYPLAVLIDSDGTIIWRGHPSDTRGGDIGQRISPLVAQMEGVSISEEADIPR